MLFMQKIINIIWFYQFDIFGKTLKVAMTIMHGHDKTADHASRADCAELAD